MTTDEDRAFLSEVGVAVTQDRASWPTFSAPHCFAAAVEFIGEVGKPFSVVGRPVDRARVRKACVKLVAVLVRLAVEEEPP